jgi:hypothetical protein
MEQILENFKYFNDVAHYPFALEVAILAAFLGIYFSNKLFKRYFS